MNQVILIGNLTRDPDQRVAKNGAAVTSFTLAVQRQFVDRDGVRKADFIPVVCWRGVADVAGKYLRKGSKVAVRGPVQVRQYEDNNGARRYITEVIADELTLLDGVGSGQAEFGIPAGDDGDEQLPF